MALTRARKRIGLVVDHPLRDLGAAALIAHLLAQRGHETVLMPFYGQNFDLGVVNPDLLVINYARPANLALVRNAQARGIPLAVLDTEGGLLPDEGPTSPEGIARFLEASGLGRALASYLFWGTALRDRVVAASRLQPHQAKVIGCPRLDLVRGPWAKTYETRDVVLVNTNFPLVNSAHAVDGEVDRGALIAIGFEEEEVDDLVSRVGAVMDRVIEAVAALAAARPDRRFVLRPHPFEREGPYRRRLGSLKNLEIRREGSVHDAIGQSACLLHVNCTTAIEAGLSGVPPISLDFANDERLAQFAALPSHISHRAGSLAEALALIDRADSLDPLARPELIEPHFGPIDGQSAQRAVDAIEETLAAPYPCTPRPRRSWRAGLLHLLGSTIGSVAIESLRQRRAPSRAEKALSSVELHMALDGFAAIQGVQSAELRRLRAPTRAPSLSLLVLPA